MSLDLRIARIIVITTRSPRDLLLRDVQERKLQLPRLRDRV
jgi:hypothetical protein